MVEVRGAGLAEGQSRPGVLCADALLGCGPVMMARPRRRLALLVPRFHRGRTGLVARIVLSTDMSRVGVFWHTGEAMGEVVQEPHDERVWALRLCGRRDRRGHFKVPTGNHVRLAGGRCALASSPFVGSVRRHLHSIRAKPTFSAA
jgi:hypothetical protein